MSENKAIGPIRITRSHYIDLEVASLNCGNPRLQQLFEDKKKDPGFEIVDEPKPGEFYHDLSVMFMYPNEIKVLKYD